MENRTKVCIIGAGAMGTSLGNALALKPELEVTLLSVEEDVIESINKNQINEKYFPSTLLTWRLKATSDVKVLSQHHFVFMAIPSSSIIEYTSYNLHYQTKQHRVLDIYLILSKS